MTLKNSWSVGDTFLNTDANNVANAVNANTTTLATYLSGVATVAGAATSGTGQTQIISYTIPAGTLVPGAIYNVLLFGTHSATTATLTYQIHVGTTNTTSDTVITSAAPGVGSSGGATFQGLLTVQTTGSSGTTIASGVGTGSSTVVATTTSTQTINTTVTNYLTVSVAASAGTHTVQQATIWPGPVVPGS